jgi:teichuronic acid biosynthesis glycosyltransferase TuaH
MATIFFGNANLPWISPLCDELDKISFTVRITILVRFRLNALSEIFTYWLKGNSHKIQNWYYPPGFNTILNLFYRPIISRRLINVVREIFKQTGEAPFVFVSDASLAKYLDFTVDYKVVYLIYDLYPEDEKGLKNHLFLLRLAEKVLCSSFELAEKVKFENPDFIDKIVYFPHGSNNDFLNKELFKEPAETYVVINGYLSARYDWEIIYKVIAALPQLRFLFVGNIVLADFNKNREAWISILNKVLKMDNVTHISDLPHNSTVQYYWASAIVWLPYDLNIEFNRYSCPLKIMDGLCSGRPVISTGISESKNHREFISICDDATSTVERISHILKDKNLPESQLFAERQLQYALNNSWANRAGQYSNIVN